MKNLNYNLVLFFLFILNNVLAQNIFFNPPTLVNSSSLAKVRDLDIGDINGDGKPDLLFASSQNNSIYLIKNDNSQSNHFDSLITITNNFYRASIVKIKDIDNDGDLDFIAAGFRQENISWFENISNGNKFSQHYIFNLTDGISSIALFDADQDGDNDLIISYWEGSKISLFEYIDGEFKDEKTIDSSAGIIAQIDNKDIDGDGLEDIVAIQLEKNKIVYYKNTPDSTRFSIMTELINTLDRPSDFAIGDVDKDGDDDLIVASRNKVFSFKNENGIFGEEQEIFNKNYSIEDIFIVDLDNDDDNDIILGNSEAGSVLSFINLDGNGNFSDGYTILNSFDGAYALGMADIDSNDTLDLCVASTYLNKIAWLPGKDGQSFYSPILINESQLQDPKYIVTGDFAGDKQSDIIVSNYRDNSLKMFKNKNFGQSYVFNVINEEGGKKERLIASSDLDNDGRIDLIEAQRNYAYSTLNWYKNLNEIGDFSVHGILVNNLPPLTYLTTADLDGDNDPDIIVVSETGNNVSYIKNKGQGKFEKDLNLITDQLQNPSMVNIADFNGDGLLDLIVSSFSNNYIYLFINNNGSFSLQQANIPNPVNTPKCIASGDLDKDGYNDIIFSSFGNYGLYWMKNVNGSFNTPKKVYPSYYSSPDKIIIKDLDSDNDPDIIIMDKTYNTVSWFENISKDGYFSKPLDIINGINGVSDIGYGFINNDSFPDILTLSENENNLYVNIAEIGPQIIKQPQDTAVCDTQDIVLTIEFDKADSLSWQVMKKNPSYFEGVSNDSIYQGVKTQNLHIKANPDLDRYKYRCMLFYNNRVFFSDTATLQVFDKIEANAGKDDTTCLSYYFLNSNLAGNGIGVWAVLNGNGEIEEPAKNFTKVNNLSTGNNTFKWTISNGLCQDYDEVVIYKFDSIQIVQQPESLSLSKGSTAQLKLTTNTDGDFQWYFNGYELTDNDRIQGSKTSSLTITDIDSTDIGNYRCFVEGYCNQIYSDLVTLDITTSTGDLEFNTVSIYPNPVKTTLNVNCYQEITFLKLLDINGKIIINLKNPKNTIDISNLDTGIYFVKIITANNIFFTKIVKM